MQIHVAFQNSFHELDLTDFKNTRPIHNKQYESMNTVTLQMIT
jgi:hypothetical protein